ncbi:MAG: 30S ribosomal protein S17 [Planctomycetes bacterium]|nr:30S ribosomal protein S17 [Planctomycetota bacterium]
MTSEANSQETDALARNRRKVVQGRVKSAKMDKTVIVQTIRYVRHPKYGKFLRRYSRFYVDDPNREAKQGDLVEIMETRPLSKLKRWRLVKVVERSERAEEFTISEPSADVAAAIKSGK